MQTSLISAEFTGGRSKNIKPQAAEAVTISKDAVKVTFNVEIAFDQTNISTTNYTLEYAEGDQVIRMVPLSVTYRCKNTRAAFRRTGSFPMYTLRCLSVTDYSGLHTRTAEDGEIR